VVVDLDPQLVSGDVVSGVDQNLHHLARRIGRVVAYLVDERLGTTVAREVAVFRREIVQQRYFKLSNRTMCISEYYSNLLLV